MGEIQREMNQDRRRKWGEILDRMNETRDED